MNYKAIYSIFSIALLGAFSANAQSVEICGNRAQGQAMVGYAPEAEKVIIDGADIKVGADGRFIFAFGRDDKLDHKIKLVDFDGNAKEYNLKIATTKWDVQHLKGVEQKKVTPSKVDEKEIVRERTDIRGAQKNNTDDKFWQGDFIIPVAGRISGNFGGQRIMNGKKMDPHMGMDIAALEGTPIKATADGIVVLSGSNNYFYSGNVVVINHGNGLYTIYAHMLNTKAKIGDKVKKGDIIGTVGKTGRVTGAHLHWGSSVNGVRFDPKSLLDKDKNCSYL